MIISISNQKGGVQKTTITFNLGYLLAEQGKKVLLIDADPQSSLTTIFNLGDDTYNIYSVLLENKELSKAIKQVDDNLDLLVGSIQLANFELNVATKIGRENCLKDVLHEIKGNYDYIFIDSPPSLGLLLLNILNASDRVIIPTQTDYLSYKGLDLLLYTIARVKDTFNKGLKILGVIATGYDSRTLHSREILELLEGMKVLGVISNSVKVKDAILAAEPLHKYEPKHKIVEQYKKIAREVLENGK